jgi:histidine triad (HIT) family protein
MGEPCIFCRIIAGDIPATVLYRDDTVTVFRDIAPAAPAHALVVPNRHIAALPDLHDVNLAGALLLAAARAAADMGLTGGYRVVANSGIDGGQSVDHLHLHVLGGRRLAWPPG